MKLFKSKIFLKKSKNDALVQQIEDSKRFKLNEYATYSKDKHNKALYLENKATKEEELKIKNIAKAIKDEAVKAGKTGKDYAVFIEENLSPKIITDAKDAILKGSLLSRDGRLQKVMALKDLCRNAFTPMVALDLALFLMDTANGGDELSEKVNRIENLIVKSIHEKNIVKRAEYDDMADRLRFYLQSDPRHISQQDIEHLESISTDLHREVITCSYLIKEIPLPEIKHRFRALNEAKSAASLINKDIYELLDRSITVMFLFTLSELSLVVAGSSKTYDRSWSLDDVLISPVSAVMAHIYSNLLCRLHLFLSGPNRINPLDRRKIKELIKIHEALFLPLEQRFKEFLSFYRSSSETVWKVDNGTVSRFVKVDSKTASALTFEDIKRGKYNPE